MGLQESQSTYISLLLAYMTFTYPRGIVENSFFQLIFVIMNMEDNEEIPIIFGWPFLYIRGVLIDLQQGKMI